LPLLLLAAEAAAAGVAGEVRAGPGRLGAADANGGCACILVAEEREREGGRGRGGQLVWVEFSLSRFYYPPTTLASISQPAGHVHLKAVRRAYTQRHTRRHTHTHTYAHKDTHAHGHADMQAGLSLCPILVSEDHQAATLLGRSDYWICTHAHEQLHKRSFARAWVPAHSPVGGGAAALGAPPAEGVA
jgi:hypothetical protein